MTAARDPYEPAHRRVVRTAFTRVERSLGRAGPTIAATTLRWMEGLAGGARVDRYYTHPEAFPMLLLPWWCERSIRGTVDVAFQTDVAYSTICGYYFVRMIDDLMDGDAPPERAVMPAMIVFHTEFQRTYAAHFPEGHAFWRDLAAVSFRSAEAAAADASAGRIDRRRFLRVSSRKVAGAKIPLAAVCHRHGRADLLARWSRLVDLFGRWHQMWDDILGWSRDLSRGQATYFLSEGARRAGRRGSIGEWVMGDGLAWGTAELERWMDDLVDGARGLRSPPLTRYLRARRAAVRGAMASLATDLAALADATRRLA